MSSILFQANALKYADALKPEIRQAACFTRKGSEHMAVLTESVLRSQYFKNQANKSVIKLPKDTILTPAAKSYLKEKKITVEYISETNQAENKREKLSGSKREEKSSQQFRIIQGGFLNEKPVHMTSLHGNLLVPKTHKRIIFRGKLDSLEAKIIEAQWMLAEKNLDKLAEDLSVILDSVRKIKRSEMEGEKLETFSLFQMDEKEIQKKAGHPEKYFGKDEVEPEYRMGIGIVLLNTIRALIRETEVAACQAWTDEDGSAEREDLISALNSLSSLCKVMMFKVNSGYYKTEKEGKK